MNFVAKHAHKFNKAYAFKEKTAYDRSTKSAEITGELEDYYREYRSEKSRGSASHTYDFRKEID